MFSLCDTGTVRLQPGGREVPSAVFYVCATKVEGYSQEVGRYPVQCFLSVIQNQSGYIQEVGGYSVQCFLSVIQTQSGYSQ